MEELIAMAKKFKAEAERGAKPGLNADELAFYDAVADNEESVSELGDETLKKITHELVKSLRKNVSVDWTVRHSLRAQVAPVGQTHPVQVQVSPGEGGRSGCIGDAAG